MTFESMLYLIFYIFKGLPEQNKALKYDQIIPMNLKVNFKGRISKTKKRL